MAREQTNDNQTNDNQIINNQTNNQIDIEKITQIVITNIEKQLDFKVFYENDANLMNEIESLKKTLKSQQMVINGLNMALFNLVSKLNVNLPNTHVTNDVTNDVNNDVNNDVTNDVTNDVNNDVTNDVNNDVNNENEDDNKPTFPTQAITIDETRNITLEYNPNIMDDIMDDTMLNPQVD